MRPLTRYLRPGSEARLPEVYFEYLRMLDIQHAQIVLFSEPIVTKRRDTKDKKFNGEIPFTYGPLAYFLKNRLYTGETGHKDKWFPGEHAAIVDRETFDQVQQLLASKSDGRKARRTASESTADGQALRRSRQPHEPELLHQKRGALSLLRQFSIVAGAEGRGWIGRAGFCDRD
jgi:hypothetical protein